MPVYEYRCPEGHRSEKFAPMRDCEKPIKCPQCGEVAVRIISLPNTDLVENKRESRSLAMPITDVKTGKAYEIHPGATFGKPNKAGMCPLIIHNRKEKLKRIKERSKAINVPLTEI